MGVTESFSSSSLTPPTSTTTTSPKIHRWLVVDFDGTCSAQDTTPLLPQLAAVLCNDSPHQRQQRLQTFGKLEQEFFQLYAEALLAERPTLMEALDALDEVSNIVTHKVSASGVLKGLHVSSGEITQILETHADLQHSARLLEDCTRVLSEIYNNRRSQPWKLGVLSINWCPSLIQAALMDPIAQHCQQFQDIPIWSNRVNRDGVVSLQVPGALAKKQQIAHLQNDDSLVVYIGDSSTDLAALIQADIGILLGNSKSTISMAQKWGYSVIDLKSQPNKNNIEELLRKHESSTIVWRADDWSEIGALLSFTSQYS